MKKKFFVEFLPILYYTSSMKDRNSIKVEIKIRDNDWQPCYRAGEMRLTQSMGVISFEV